MNTKNVAKLLLIFIASSSILFVNHLSSFVNFQLLRKANKNILILGDFSHEQLSEKNGEHVDWLYNQLPLYSPNPINIIYELSSEFESLLSNDEEIDIRIGATSICLYCHPLKNKIPNATFSPFHIEGNESKVLENFFARFNAFFTQKPTEKIWQRMKVRYIKKLNDNRNKLLVKSEFLSRLKENVDNIKRLRNVFQENSLEYSMLNEGLHTYSEQVDKVEKYLKDAPEKDIRLILVDCFNYCKTPKSLKEKYEELITIFCKKADYIYKDLIIINNIIRSFNVHDYTIAVLSKMHADKIVKMLHILGFTEILSYSAVQYDKSKNTVKIIAELLNPILEKLASGFNLMFNLPEDTQINVIKDMKDELNHTPSCATCNINETHSRLFHCGRCMRVFYCSKECQKKDWPKHKLKCQHKQVN